MKEKDNIPQAHTLVQRGGSSNYMVNLWPTPRFLEQVNITAEKGIIAL